MANSGVNRDDVKRSRVSAQSWLTRAVNQCSTLAQSDMKLLSEVDYNSALATFNERLGKWDDAQAAYEAIVEEDELENLINVAADFRERAVKCRDDLISKWLKSKENKENHANDVQSTRSVAPQVNLPRIDLPKFSGDVLKFTSFWQQFKSCVDDLDFPTIAKFNYLLSCLKGEARTVIEGMPVVEENYRSAMEMLEERYGRKELIVFSHVQELLAINVPEQLTKFRDILNVHVRSLAAQGITSDKFGVILTPIIVSKLPEEIRLEWSRDSEGKEDDLDHLLKFLDSEINRRERCRSFGTLQPNSQAEKQPQDKQKNKQSSATALHAGSSGTANEAVRKCVFCSSSNHASMKCGKYLGVGVAERYEMLKNAYVCFKCLSAKHRANKCGHKCGHCKGFHHVTICRKAESCGSDEKCVQNVSGNACNLNLESSGENCGANLLSVNHKTVSLMPLACVKVNGKQATVLFDSGSDKSYVSQGFVNKVKPKYVRQTSVSFATFGGRSHGAKAKMYEFSMRSVCSREEVTVQLPEVPLICLPLGKPKVDSRLLEEFDHLDLAFDYKEYSDSSSHVTIDILIGQDLYWSVMLGDVFRSESSNLVAQKSVFGWTLSGCTSGSNSAGISLLNVGIIPEQVAKSFWDLESLGIKGCNESVDPVLDKFNENIEYNTESGRYKVPLMWRENYPVLQDNYGKASSQFCSLENRLDKDAMLKARYNDALSEMEDKGFVVEVTEKDSSNKVHYLPHHPHVREASSTTKIRPVFNASCKGGNGVSLNDCLESGPNLNPNIVDVLLRFRRWQYAVTADVSKAFLQIELADSDQDVHRFLWRKDREGSMRVMKFVRVTFGIKCSPFLLSATIKHHLSLRPPSFVVKELTENLYVDDLLSGADTETEAEELLSEAKRVMSKAGMVLAKWKSNHSHIVGETVSDSKVQYVKILGVSWDSEQDVFTFNCVEVARGLPITKRSVLSFLARVFDPMGFVLPFTVGARHLFQDVWRLGLDWDKELPMEMQKAFKSWLAGLKVLKGVRIPRRYFKTVWSECIDEVELHAFGDASLRGYGACVYIVHRSSSEVVECTLVRASARVAPLQRKTLPRLELLGSLVTAQLLKKVIESLCLPDHVPYYCWTDSMVALGWIKGRPSRWKPWVANRVTTIQSLTDPVRWKHVAGKENPADILTRGISAKDLVESSLWWKGPEFLMQNANEETEVEFPQDDPLVEVERRNEGVSLICADDSPKMFQFERWSNLNKAYRIIAYVLRFVQRTRKHQTAAVGTVIRPEEYSTAQTVYCRLIQKQHFPSELQAVKAGQRVARESKLSRLSPFLDEKQVLRVHGRIQLSELAYESKHPVILPKCHGSLLLVRHVHHLQKHAGVDAMITFIRKDFEIFGLRQMAKSVKRGCVACMRYDAKPCNEVAAPLPKDRVTMAPAFSVTGIDFAGPVYCLNFPDVKFYICLFVCGVTRAIHLELVDSLSVDDFILAFRRFAALKRMPSVVYSDNATNFSGGQKKLAKLLGVGSPQWKFICPRSPWWGGWWERLVRSVKGGIRKTIGKSCLTKVEMQTCLSEIAVVVNSRPLTFVGTDVENKNPLTPNHFLLGQSNQSLQCTLTEDPENMSVEVLSLKEQEMVQRQKDFWSVWSSDYLRNLPPAYQKFQKAGQIKVGSVVLIKEDNMPKMRWSLGVVKKLHIGRDGIPRAADLDTRRGQRTRAIQRLYNLEITDCEKKCSDCSKFQNISAENNNVDDCPAGKNEKVGLERPKRLKRLPKRFEDYTS